jgi:hypothetical protein
MGEWRNSSTIRELSASRPGCITSGERAPGTHWIGGWVSPRAAGLDDVEKTRSPAVQPVARRYADAPQGPSKVYKYTALAHIIIY